MCKTLISIFIIAPRNKTLEFSINKKAKFFSFYSVLPPPRIKMSEITSRQPIGRPSSTKMIQKTSKEKAKSRSIQENADIPKYRSRYRYTLTILKFQEKHHADMRTWMGGWPCGGLRPKSIKGESPETSRINSPKLIPPK